MKYQHYKQTYHTDRKVIIDDIVRHRKVHFRLDLQRSLNDDIANLCATLQIIHTLDLHQLNRTTRGAVQAAIAAFHLRHGHIHRRRRGHRFAVVAQLDIGRTIVGHFDVGTGNGCAVGQFAGIGRQQFGQNAIVEVTTAGQRCGYDMADVMRTADLGGFGVAEGGLGGNRSFDDDAL